MKNYFSLFISLLLIIGCSEQNNDYFPLDKIKTWNYTVKIQPDVDDAVIYKKTNQSLGKKKIFLNNENYEVYPFLKEDGTIMYYQSSDDGIYRNGIKFNKDIDFKIIKKNRMVLPYPIRIGKKWEVDSKTFLILKRYPYYDYRATTNFKLNYEILSTKEVIQTPLGKFKNCLKIRGTGKTSFIGDSEIGSIIIEVLSEEWYAKDIGLIKTVRTEKTDTDLFGTTKMVQILDNFEKK
ncbi:MAG: hypothetical protein CMP34_04125 [Rickettsiales bacterium]|nr:hypothetical protein [Rickettsiales bacterium]|tara:strand:- start:449 stop:1156 length:708 start_codon:yes stop_codon:yes gene_type:complete